MIDSKIGNFRYLEFPRIQNITYSSPTYSHLKYLESDRSGISMFHKALEDIQCLANFNAKSIKVKQRILKQLDFLTIYSSRAIRNIPLQGTHDPITSPEIYLNGHSYFTKSYRRSVMSGGGIRSKPIQADLKIEFSFGAATDEELLIEAYGSSDAILSVQPDRTFRFSQEDIGTSVRQSIAVHETMARSHEDMNLRVNDI